MKDVAGQIRSRLSAEAADRAVKEKAEQIRPPLQAAKDFMAEAKTLGLAPVETTMARRRSRAGSRRLTDTLEEAAFALAQGGVSTPVTTPAGLVLIKVVGVVPAGVPPLAEVRDKVTASVKRQKAETAALERAKQLAADAQRAAILAAAARKAGAVTGETARFSRAKPAERLPADAMMAALQTPAGQTERAGQGAAGLLRGEGARARAAGHERARGRARQAPEGNARPEAEPRLGILAQRSPRERRRSRRTCLRPAAANARQTLCVSRPKPGHTTGAWRTVGSTEPAPLPGRDPSFFEFRSCTVDGSRTRTRPMTKPRGDPRGRRARDGVFDAETARLACARIVNYAGDLVEESRAAFGTIAIAVAERNAPPRKR